MPEQAKKTHVFLTGSVEPYKVLLSPTEAFLSEIPTQEAPKNLFHLVARRWATDDWFYTMFVPEHHPLDDIILQPLLSDFSTLEVYNENGRVLYGLSSPTIERWHSLETFLISVAEILARWSRLVLPREALPPPTPSSYGYSRRYESLKAARKALSLSRTAFIVNAALVCYELCALGDRVPPGRTEPWYMEFPKLGIMTPSAVELIEGSWIGLHVARRRLGCFIDLTVKASLPQWLHDLEAITQRFGQRLPMYFYYGGDPVACLRHTIARTLYEPSKELIEERIAGASEWRNSARQSWTCPATNPQPWEQGLSHNPLSEGTVDPNVPTPFTGSRQQHGEDMSAFFKREAEHVAHVIAQESEEQRKVRMNRARDEQLKPYPTWRGAAVFHWVKVRGFWLRQRVWPKKYHALWDDTKPAHRRYNSVQNEWDVSILLDPTTSVDEDYKGWDTCAPESIYGEGDEVEWDTDNDWASREAVYTPQEASQEALRLVQCDRSRSRSMSPIRAGTLTRRPSPGRPDVHAAQVLANAADTMLTLESTGVQSNSCTVITDPLLLTISNRYGFKPVLSAPIATESNAKFALRVLAEFWLANMFSGPELPSIVSFVKSSLDGNVAQCDIAPNHQEHLALQQAASTLLRREQAANGTIMYVIGKPANESWLLVVEQALTALEIVRRRWGPRVEDIVPELVQRGIRFAILWPRSPSPEGSSMTYARPPTGWPALGFRHPGYQPISLDYRVYVERRREVLSRPNAAAALARGGIIWRLAYEELNPGKVIFEPVETGQVAYHTIGKLWYEAGTLSEDELNCICGVYRVYTDGSREVASESSWWPKDFTWWESGMSVGYWTRQNEDWYVRRRKRLEEAIRDGKPGDLNIRTSTAWRKALRFELSKQSVFLDVMEKESQAFLDACTANA